MSEPTVAAATLELWQQFPANVTDPEPSNGYPWMRWLDGVGQLLDRVDVLARDDATGNPGWSVLLDVDRCPTRYLQWLGQWVGVRVQPTWSDAQARAAIQAESAFGRGTPAALVAAARRWIKPGKSVALKERTTDAYHFQITAYQGELLGSSYRDLSLSYNTYTALGGAAGTYAGFTYSASGLIQALTDAKPAGLVMDFQLLSGASYQDLTNAFHLYSDLTAAFPDYADMIVYVP